MDGNKNSFQSKLRLSSTVAYSRRLFQRSFSHLFVIVTHISYQFFLHFLKKIFQEMGCEALTFGMIAAGSLSSGQVH